MRIKHSILAIMILLIAPTGKCWNKVGHDASAYIAECHLTPRAKANIERYLDGKSIVYHASWLDLIRLTPEYTHTYKWHGAMATPDCKYMPRPSGNSDVIKGFNETYNKLCDGKYKNLSDSAVAVGIKILIHIIPDMHCPGHVSFEDYPQADIKFKTRDLVNEFHSYWDGAPDLVHKWYYTDYQYQLDRYSKDDYEKMVQGTPLEWFEENARRFRIIYSWIQNNAEYDRAQTYDLQLKTSELIDDQIVLGGYRLAKILNDLFDN